MEPPTPDSYQDLGVPDGASFSDIKLAYQKVVLRYKLDIHVGDALREEKADEFRRGQEAFERVGYKDERWRYDSELQLSRIRARLQRARQKFQDHTAALVSISSEYSPRYAPQNAPPLSRPSAKTRPIYSVTSRTVSPSGTSPSPPSLTERPSTGIKDTEDDARRADIPAGYSYKNWDPTKEPITLFGSVFHNDVLDKSINGRTASKTRHSTALSEETTTVYEIPIMSSNRRNGDGELLQIDALGDYCAKFNFIKEDYAARLGLSVNRKKIQSIRIGSGKRITTIGTTSLLPFRFKDETDLHSPLFHVIPNCLHNVILGRPFLKMTQTFSALANFTRRVKERVLHGFAHHFLYLGDSMPRFSGLINGKPWEALADSGSKVPVMDEAFAQKSGLRIAREQRYKTTLRFADGSTAETSGMVHGVQWEFGPGGEEKHFLDFHVLRNAPADVILSDRFLFGTNAFSRYDCYLVDDEEEEDDDAYFFAIDLDKQQRAQGMLTVPGSVEHPTEVHRSRCSTR